MRSEKEIRNRLAYVRREMVKVVTLRNRLWRVMELQIYESQLMWVLKEKPVVPGAEKQGEAK